MLRSRISWTCVIGVIVSMSVWMASFCIMRWSIGHQWHLVSVYIKLNERIHAFQNGVHKLQHVSVTTLDSGIQLLAQINPYADNLWKLWRILYVPVLTMHLIDISALQFMAQSISSVLIPPGHLLGICRLVGPCGEDLSENLNSGVGHWSILLEEVNVVPFLYFT